MPNFKSKAIKRAEYDQDTGRMQIWFPRSGPYDFCGVPIEVWEELLQAPSKGTFYNSYIRDQYEC